MFDQAGMAASHLTLGVKTAPRPVSPARNQHVINGHVATIRYGSADPGTLWTSTNSLAFQCKGDMSIAGSRVRTLRCTVRCGAYGVDDFSGTPAERSAVSSDWCRPAKAGGAVRPLTDALDA